MLKICENYDERQQQLRGRICKHIMVMLAAAIMINAFAEEFGFVWQDKIYGGFILVLVPTAIGTIEMNLCGVYLTKKMKGILYFFGVIILTNLVPLVLHPEPFITNGSISVFGQRLVVEICFIVILASSLIRMNYDKKQEKAEE